MTFLRALTGPQKELSHLLRPPVSVQQPALPLQLQAQWTVPIPKLFLLTFQPNSLSTALKPMETRAVDQVPSKPPFTSPMIIQ